MTAMIRRLLLGVLALLGLAALPAHAQIAAVTSPSGPVLAGPYVVVDAATGETLLERNAGYFWHPASLTKMMTLYIVFEELKSGRLTLASPFSLSESARAKPPSKLGLGPGQSITVEQGIQALVARSANDVAVGFAELIGGSEAAFSVRMTETAARIGMNGTQFHNASGWPHPGQITTARDMALLAMALIKQFPEYYGYFHTTEFMLGKARIGPGIKFLDLYSPYADGLKTGFTCASGFNIVGSAVRDGRRLIAVAFGFRRADLRDEFIVRLLDEAYALKTGGNRPKVWQIRDGQGGPATVMEQSECGTIRYDMPGDAVWLGTYGDWRTARHAYDVGQAELARLGITRLGKEYILPVTSNKVTRQAAIIADLEPAAAQKLCADYQARKLFCQIRKPQDFAPPFSGFWR
ncbi:D-alanyl-D-alanine carboxypeptidase family protein [Reyranella sp.]|uniref:D-alanyl-D-alanine carboxypeptidase family protein n=1 Tax=Reyranella sp. TaxID=1929291 RepID=UPI003BAB5EE4